QSLSVHAEILLYPLHSVSTLFPYTTLFRSSRHFFKGRDSAFRRIKFRRDKMSINVFAGPRKALVASIALAAVLGGFTASGAVFASDTSSTVSTTVTLSAKVNSFTNTDWLNGVWRAAPALSIPASSANNAAFKVGASVRLADGQIRKITKVYVVGSNLSVFLDGAVIDGNKVGAPNVLSAVTVST